MSRNRAAAERGRPRAVLICHAESRLNRDGIARWLSSFTNLAGIVLIDERPRHVVARVRREMKRVGILRLFDVAAFRVYYRLVHARADRVWLTDALQQLARRYAPLAAGVDVLHTTDPNSPEAEAFIRKLAPDIAIARCKCLLRERVFSIPAGGTFVLHPGICPEYRNAHGAFWALASGDLDKVGLTLLRIDRGVDTGPVYGYFSCSFDEVRESHIVIMTRLVLENLDAIQRRLIDAIDGCVQPVDVSGRRSAAWGQPWLSCYLRWKSQARKKRSDARAVARIS
jgi:hypothetical protein